MRRWVHHGVGAHRRGAHRAEGGGPQEQETVLIVDDEEADEEEKEEELAGRSEAGRSPKDDAEQKVVAMLTEAFSSVLVDDAVSAFREAKGHPNKGAEILVQSLVDTSDEPFTSFTLSGVSSFDTGSDDQFTSSLSSGVSESDTGSTSGPGSSEGFELGCVQNLVSERGFRNKQKRVVASAGTVLNVLGKENVRSRMTKLSGSKNGDASGEEEAKQFLCSMIGDDSELNLAVVRDVLCKWPLFL
ncbi:SMR domain-containing protein At5g58720-like [Rosa chinensis]|uniref:SMR domain-containing protein At5g58720-like n=1 Tax=Rosa chinensis TaxID=74649 RepID=UPI001AD8A749|nr:SMR domain-containing protein At5g58720-like [Rosa chinensis]